MSDRWMSQEEVEGALFSIQTALDILRDHARENPRCFASSTVISGLASASLELGNLAHWASQKKDAA